MHHTDRNIHRSGFTCAGNPKPWPKPSKRGALPFLLALGLLAGSLAYLTVSILSLVGV